MQVQRFSIEGPVLFTPKRWGDERGFFAEVYRQDVFEREVGRGLSCRKIIPPRGRRARCAACISSETPWRRASSCASRAARRWM